VNKRELVDKVVEQLTAEVEGLFKAARAAHAEATHEQSKAEDKYDTRGLEASYLTRGQSRQAAEIGQAIAEFQALPLRNPRLISVTPFGGPQQLRCAQRNAILSAVAVAARGGDRTDLKI